MSSPFDDLESIASDAAAKRDADRRRVQACESYCEAGLNGFIQAAAKVGTSFVQLEMDSVAAQSAGIALAAWPTTSVGGKTVARYYSILTHSEFDFLWTAADGQGVTITLDGQTFSEGKACSVSYAAALIARLVGYDTEQAKELFTAALRNEPYSYG